MSGDLTYGTVPVPCPGCSREGTDVYHSGRCYKVVEAAPSPVRCPACGDLHECQPIEIHLSVTKGFG